MWGAQFSNNVNKFWRWQSPQLKHATHKLKLIRQCRPPTRSLTTNAAVLNPGTHCGIEPERKATLVNSTDVHPSVTRILPTFSSEAEGLITSKSFVRNVPLVEGWTGLHLVITEVVAMPNKVAYGLHNGCTSKQTVVAPRQKYTISIVKKISVIKMQVKVSVDQLRFPEFSLFAKGFFQQ